MALCECGCGVEAEGTFLSGHDQRLRTDLETRVGGLLALRALVRAMEAYATGDTPIEALGQAVRRAFWSQRGAV